MISKSHSTSLREMATGVQTLTAISRNCLLRRKKIVSFVSHSRLFILVGDKIVSVQ
jgi:hypothetical protein